MPQRDFSVFFNIKALCYGSTYASVFFFDIMNTTCTGGQTNSWMNMHTQSNCDTIISKLIFEYSVIFYQKSYVILFDVVSNNAKVHQLSDKVTDRKIKCHYLPFIEFQNYPLSLNWKKENLHKTEGSLKPALQ